MRLDYLLPSPGLQRQGHRWSVLTIHDELTDSISDHYPAVLELRWGPQAASHA